MKDETAAQSQRNGDAGSASVLCRVGQDKDVIWTWCQCEGSRGSKERPQNVGRYHGVLTFLLLSAEDSKRRVRGGALLLAKRVDGTLANGFVGRIAVGRVHMAGACIAK